MSGMSELSLRAPMKRDPLPEESASVPAMVNDATSLMAVISRAASDPAVDVDKLERLLTMYERVKSTEAERSFNAAMNTAQAEMAPVRADANNSQTRSKYATYVALDQAIRPIYTKHGFSLSFNTAPADQHDYVRVICIVSHAGGFSRTYQVDMPADGKGAKGGDVMTKTHAAGSAFTYSQRYLLKLIWNIAVGEWADDDGNMAGADAYITEDKRHTIEALMEACGADKRRFCEHFKIDSIAQLPARDYQRAERMLQDKARGKP